MNEQNTTESKKYCPHPSTVAIIVAVAFAAGIMVKGQFDKAPLVESNDRSCQITVSGDADPNSLNARIRVQGSKDACETAVSMLMGQYADSNLQPGDDSDADAASTPSAASK